MAIEGWEHDCLSRGYPYQFGDVYSSIDWNPYRVDFHDSRDTELYHVHGELHHYFPVMDLKESGKPVVLNVHDLACARAYSIMDVWEAEALDAADAHVWVTKEQRDFATAMGLNTDKPYAIVPNYVSSQVFVSRSRLPHIGGVVYQGSLGNKSNDRDFSPVAEALGDEFFIFGEQDPGYGRYRGLMTTYPVLIERLAQHDWGYAGYHEPAESWAHSLPTKAFEYLAAGLPIISQNTPLLRPLVEMGLGIEVERTSQLKNLPDPAPFRRRVLKERHRFTTERHIGDLVRLYERLTA
jgi:hypothetical protein